MGLFKKKDQNFKRLLSILGKIKNADSPERWEKVTTSAVGGLSDLGFSKNGPFLLVVSSQGRGVFDCNTGEKVARDYEDSGGWINTNALYCDGIGPLENEQIQICGIHGGGLPLCNRHGESVTVVAPNWPVYDLYFCRDYKSVLIEGHEDYCCKLD